MGCSRFFMSYGKKMGSDFGVCKARGLGKVQLGGVIFGATKATINECLSKQLFGLPGSHFVYVKKIEPGLPLFLYNYSDKTLVGIFEAASSGQMNIDPYAWTLEGSQRTTYPAQVQIRVKLHCRVLTENQFKPIIADNYFNPHHFWFELDHAQSNKLLSLLSTQALSGPRATLAPHSTIKPKTFLPLEKERARNINPVAVGGHLNGSKSLPSNIKDIKAYTTLTPHNSMKQPAFLPLEKESVCHMSPQVIGGHLNGAKSFPSNSKEFITMRLKDLAQKRNLVASGPPSSDRKNDTDVANNMTVEKKEDKSYPVIAHAAAQAEIRNLKGTCNTISVQTCVGSQEFDDIKGKEIISDSLPDDSTLLIGGYNGVSWLSSLDCYSPSQNLIVSYDPAKNRWTFCPPLNQKNGSLAGATVKDKIYAHGGGNGVDCHSAVEMLDFDVGASIPTRSMLQKPHFIYFVNEISKARCKHLLRKARLCY
ncbi:development/cell death domain, Galactose oxidase, beta-propeller [Artemisia annua]|uniref:Development/cell death domain, Galactose oxidase, beta-propeller n=1 Tax=Artemisia annua TaxID=35608 RepID=A0A2U1KFF1_ARTAN|nr:development/cell death domain, Galactose oxidase, beta-propeller [Artemisia annua]